LDKFILNFHRAGEEYVKTAKGVGSTGFGRTSNRDLARFYKKYIFAQEKYNSFLWAGNFIGEYLSKLGEELLASKGFHGKEKNEAIELLFKPSKRCGVLLLQAKMLEFKKQGYKTLPSLASEKLLKEFAFLPCLDLNNEPWKAADIEEFYRQYVPAETKSAGIKNKIRQTKFTLRQKQLLRLIQQISFIKDMRDVYRRKGVFNALPFFKEIALRMGVRLSEVGFCTHGEIFKFLTQNKSVEKRTLTSRAKGFLFYGDTLSPVVTTDAREIKKFYDKVNSHTGKKDVAGVIASSGFAKDGQVSDVSPASVIDISKKNKINNENKEDKVIYSQVYTLEQLDNFAKLTLQEKIMALYTSFDPDAPVTFDILNKTITLKEIEDAKLSVKEMKELREIVLKVSNAEERRITAALQKDGPKPLREITISAKERIENLTVIFQYLTGSLHGHEFV
jgi:hypothetical protein